MKRKGEREGSRERLSQKETKEGKRDEGEEQLVSDRVDYTRAHECLQSEIVGERGLMGCDRRE